MKFFHNIKIKIFVKPEESTFSEENIKEILEKLSGLNFVSDKIKLNKEVVEGFDQRKIIIYDLELIKENHTKRFVDSILSKIGKTQIKKILDELESRIDEELKFYLRIDKNKILEEQYKLTDSGNCIHVSMQVASFPKNVNVAKDVVSKILIERLQS